MVSASEAPNGMSMSMWTSPKRRLFHEPSAQFLVPVRYWTSSRCAKRGMARASTGRKTTAYHFQFSPEKIRLDLPSPFPAWKSFDTTHKMGFSSKTWDAVISPQAVPATTVITSRLVRTCRRRYCRMMARFSRSLFFPNAAWTTISPTMAVSAISISAPSRLSR